MKRRDYLARIAALGSVGSVAGCLRSRGAPASDGESPTVPTETGTPTGPRTPPDSSTPPETRTAADPATSADRESPTPTPSPTETPPGDGGSTATPRERTPTPPERTPVATHPGITASFSAENGSCGSLDGDASVAFEGGSIAVDGRLVTPVPCYSATLDGVTVESGVLEVRVGEVPPPEGTVCIQCVGSVPYSATVDPGDVTVERVRVVHVGRGMAETVAVVDRP